MKDNIIWLGNNNPAPKLFYVPTLLEERKNIKKDENGNLIATFGNICWYTNLDIKKRHEDLILIKRYNEDDYPKYDNYDAIEVSRVKNIPYDYEGVMGVPITFMDKYNPDQFEILGAASGRKEFDKRAYPTKRYENAIQHNKNGTVTSGSKVNTGAAILMNTVFAGKQVYYTADNASGPLTIVYARILIKNKHPEIRKES